MAVERIGLLGGSFDPVHLAHIELAQNAVESLHLDQLQLLPAANPWQRAPLAATAEHRLAMLKLASAGYPKLSINTSEIERGGATYTIDTLRELPPGPVYYWVIGADQLQNLCSWRDWQEIVQRVELAVGRRPGNELIAPDSLHKQLLQLNKSLHYLSLPPIYLSATEIRRRLAQGAGTEGLLDPSVATYIQHHRLYQPNTFR
ncbi:nicotinate (nicotinamide) nucleotide adenylyltransferase [Paenalcaligenes niemegkensis]|uniref:nicotinate (nicotinamide) nucleotide adenylyltransferase n=1 Tax=Paenalcaligenes niemegkensis TaxID=2895469 RepID=UPI001EE97967|nr:nicotinate (nicotinamide) nucleotide adenylyltransferase [Paenalcaligenes niemegkensis]MCQ9616834.1 nicotinate (nicotinamide) nucleotide adenylyltransferase [Paenalcaligenes niemegkensis]